MMIDFWIAITGSVTFDFFFLNWNCRASFANESVSLIQELLGVVLPVGDARQATNIRHIWCDMCARDALAKQSAPIVLTWTIGKFIWTLTSAPIWELESSCTSAHFALTFLIIPMTVESMWPGSTRQPASDPMLIAFYSWACFLSATWQELQM